MVRRPPPTVRRIVFLGTPEIAVTPLRALHEAGFEIPLVVTRADRRRGRGADLHPSPVKAAAIGLGLAVSSEVDDVLAVDADLGVVVAFGRIIKPHVLDHLAMVNLHFSLLPRWRGAAPVERAILAGDRTTGVCVMALEERLDTGGIYRQESVDIGDKTLAELQAELAAVGTEMLVEALRKGLGDTTPQVGEVSYADKIEPNERHIDWAQPADHVARVIRLGDAWTTLDGSRLKVWDVAVSDAAAELAPGEIAGTQVGTGSGTITLREVQPAGKPRRSAGEWANGARLEPGTRFE